MFDYCFMLFLSGIKRSRIFSCFQNFSKSKLIVNSSRNRLLPKKKLRNVEQKLSCVAFDCDSILDFCTVKSPNYPVARVLEERPGTGNLLIPTTLSPGVSNTNKYATALGGELAVSDTY